MQKLNKIDSFKGAYAWLSNFYQCTVAIEGKIYQNSEAAFQAHKCANPKDRERFTNLNPNEAKSLGRTVKLRSDWEESKTRIMYDIVKAKFTQHTDLKDKLLATKDAELIEGNTWGDTYWGVCNNIGQNHLGKTLMQVREDLRKEE